MRFEVLIVAVLVVAAAGLALWQWWRPTAQPFSADSLSVTLLLAALTVAVVPTFSYLPPGAKRWALGALALGAVAAAALVRRPGRGPRLAAGVGTAAYLVAAVTAVVTDRAPRIDVWVTLQQASDGMLRGENMYAMTWTGSPGIKDAFTYLPWTGVLLAPGRWLFGDVRWALLCWTLVATAGLWRLAAAGRASEPAGEPWPVTLGAVPLLLLAPGTLTQVDQAWTEPLLLAALVWWAVLVRSGSGRATWWAIVPLALACASKQHLALLLPAVAVWRPFGLRRTVATGALAGALVLPWFLAGPADFLHDTVLLLVGFHPIRFANTLYLLALNRYGVTLPFWLTGMAVLGALAAISWTIWRRQPQLSELLRWLALLLLVANLVNKQAFYNQFWLSAGLLAASLAASEVGRQGPAQTGPRQHERSAGHR